MVEELTLPPELEVLPAPSEGVGRQGDALLLAAAAGGVGQPLAGGGLLEADAVVLAPGVDVEHGHFALNLGAQLAGSIDLDVLIAGLELDLLGASGVVEVLVALVGNGHDAAQSGQAHVLTGVGGARHRWW